MKVGRVLDRSTLGACLATDALLADPEWLGLVRELMHETIDAAQAQGFALSAEVADEQIERTRQMGAYRASTLLDFESGRPLEIEALFSEPLRRARAAGMRPCRLAALEAVLRELDALRQARAAGEPSAVREDPTTRGTAGSVRSHTLREHQ
jgi:2-dehydropantoate 2-reductase